MKYLYPLLWLFVFLSCNDVLPDAEETEGEIEIFPDYKEVAVPCNIAPLNFKLKEPCEAIALFSGKDLQIRVDSDNGSFQIPEKKWRRLLDASAGSLRSGSIFVKRIDGFAILLFPFRLSKIRSIPIWSIAVSHRATGCGTGWGFTSVAWRILRKKLFLTIS